MNIFALDNDPKTAAVMHLDKHVIKMVTEYNQLLSTAHRVLDGTYVEKTHPDTNKVRKFYVLPGEEIKFMELPKPKFSKKEQKEFNLLSIQEQQEIMKPVFRHDITNPVCYRQSHMTHPCGIWARTTSENYQWLFSLYNECLIEYTRRYGKPHGASKNKKFLSRTPSNIKSGDRTAFGTAMPEQYKVEDAIQSYKNYYIGEKVSFAEWTNTPVPDWFLEGVGELYDESHFARTR